MPITEAAATAIAAGAQAASAGTQAYMSGRANRKTIKANMKLAELAYQRQVSMFNMSNDYNSPEAQMERLRKAGLNPNLVYGSGADNTTAVSTPQYNPPDVTRKAYVPDVAPAINQFLNTKMQLAQIENVNANTENVRARTQTEAFNTKLKEILGQKTGLETDFMQLTNPYKSDTLKEKHLGAALQNEKLAQEIFNLRESEVKTKLENEYKRNQISQQQIDKEIKQAELLYKQNENALNNMGINRADSWYLRAIIRALNSGNLSFSTDPTESIKNSLKQN